VIGVGIQESSSDILVQNCDEYYSYTSLSGLRKTSDSDPRQAIDPWVLVERAVEQMVSNDDVMRSDRLKQVLLELDPGFDEKALGFQKFNKFLNEAASRGLLSLSKQDNGQFEIGPPDETAAAEPQTEQRPEGRRGRGRRGRGRRDEARPREPEEPVIAAAAEEVTAVADAAAVAPEPEVSEETPAATTPEPEAEAVTPAA
jgi:hypothetical protein